MRIQLPFCRFHPGRFPAFKTIPVWLPAVLLELITIPGLPENQLVRETMETAGIIVLP